MNMAIVTIASMYIIFGVIFLIAIQLIYMTEKDYQNAVECDSMLKIIGEKRRKESSYLLLLSGVEIAYCPILLIMTSKNIGIFESGNKYSLGVYYSLVLGYMAAEFIAFYCARNINRYFSFAFWCLFLFSLLLIFNDLVPQLSFLQYVNNLKCTVIFSVVALGCRKRLLSLGLRKIPAIFLVFPVILPILSAGFITTDIKYDYYNFSELSMNLTDSSGSYIYITIYMSVYLLFGIFVFISSLELKKPQNIVPEIRAYVKDGNHNDQ